jgi:hypothetical protein
MRVFLLAGSVLLAGCSTVPPLSGATGTEDSPILIADVITRVKCEIADAFDELRPYRRFDWLQDWTAKADLTLQINTQAGVSPSGSYTKFQKNAFNFDAGSTSLASNTIAAVSQFFALTASANIGEQAVRTETVSFSLALDELHEWRKHVHAIESAPDFPPESRVCDYGGARELRGDLGLREWVASAFFPVYRGDLWAGDHPPPGTGKAQTSPTAVPLPKPITGTAAFAQENQPSDTEIKDINEAFTTVEDSALQASLSLDNIKLTVQTIKDALNAAIKVRDKTVPVGSPKAVASTADIVKTLQDAYNSANADADGAYRAINQTQNGVIPPEKKKNAEDNFKLFNDNAAAHRPYDYATLVQQTKADAAIWKTVAANAKRFQDHAQALQKTAALVSYTPDPPIDGILHSVQFVVAYGGGITPSWTLITWKGPGLNAPAASAQGTRTNILNLALGPRTGATKSTPEQNRLINNTILLLTRPSQ